MYEDENNLYHYSYRKGDEQNPNAPIDTKNYAEDPWDKNPGGSPKKKGGSGLSGKIVALALVCALVGGFIGAGVSGATTKVNKTSVQVSDREVAQVQTVKVDGKTQMSMFRSTSPPRPTTSASRSRPPPAARAFSSRRTATSSRTTTSSPVRAA